MSISHSFSVKVACAVGERKAVMLNNFGHWHEKNGADAQHIYDGHVWTYNSVAGFAKLWPYLSEREIRTALDSLEKDGWVITGNYNEWKIDRTKWYALTEKSCDLLEITFVVNPHLTKRSNASDRNDKSILPDSQIHLPDESNPSDSADRPIPIENTIKDSIENKKGSDADATVFEGEVVVVVQAEKKGKAPPIPRDPPKIATMIQAVVKSFVPEYYWDGKNGAAALAVAAKLRNAINARATAKAGGQAVANCSDDEVVNALHMLITRSYELSEYYQFKDLPTLNGRFNEILTQLKNGKSKSATNQQNRNRTRQQEPDDGEELDRLVSQMFTS